jgi:hypothetical protein
MGDKARSVKTRAQNNEMRFRVIAYNAARIASLASSLVRGFLLSQLPAILKMNRGTAALHDENTQLFRADWNN